MEDLSDYDIHVHLDKTREMLRSEIDNIIHTITHVSGKEMYDKVILLVDCLIEAGIDIVSQNEKKSIVSLAETLVIRYTRERTALGFTPFLSDKVYTAINFLRNLPV